MNTFPPYQKFRNCYEVYYYSELDCYDGKLEISNRTLKYEQYSEISLKSLKGGSAPLVLKIKSILQPLLAKSIVLSCPFFLAATFQYYFTTYNLSSVVYITFDQGLKIFFLVRYLPTAFLFFLVSFTQELITWKRNLEIYDSQ